MSNGTQRFTIWHGLFLAEGAALMIALLMPITPSKTGSGRGLAHFLIPDPTYFEQVVVYFVLTNVLILVISAIVWIWMKLT
jgi:hypothetical protein